MTSLSSKQAFDQLREVMNIGAGNAASALSSMTDKEVLVDVPRIELLPIEGVPEFVGVPDDVMTAVLLKIEGETPGVILFFLPENQATALTHLLTKREAADMNEMDKSALLEIGNILTGSCFAALGNFLSIPFSQSVPDTATDMIGAMLSPVLSSLGEQTDDVLTSQVHFSLSSESIGGDAYFIFDPESSIKILQATDRKLSPPEGG